MAQWQSKNIKKNTKGEIKQNGETRLKKSFGDEQQTQREREREREGERERERERRVRHDFLRCMN